MRSSVPIQGTKFEWAPWPFVAVLLVALNGGCSGAGEVCKELGRCGGDVVGTWIKKSDHSYCQERTYPLPPDSYLIDQPAPLARMPLPEAQNLDWCSNLVINLDPERPVRSAVYYSRDLPLIEAKFQYKPDGLFDIGLARRARFTQHYSRTCLTQYGFSGQCSALAEGLTKHNQGNPAVSLFECNEQKEKGGCDCSFQYEEVSVLTGSYSIQGTAVTHFAQSPALRFNQTGYCVRGDSMEVSGLNNNYILDRLGLRSVELVKVKCDDGEKGHGEEGVDCGVVCGKACE